MHGTVVMLMALSGLGCHHKHADVAYVPSCYSSISDGCYSGCYSSTSYETPYATGCYSSADYIGGCYSESCYSGGFPSCYSERRGCFLTRLFHGGLFKKHHRGSYAPIETSCYSSCYSSSYEPAVFGTSLPIYETPWASAQVPSKSIYTIPSTQLPTTSEAPATPAPTAPAPAAAPADAPKTTTPDETAAPSTTPPPPPTPASAVEDAVKSVTPAAPNAKP
ncbi:hypothetical protein [Paludisphaera mucosa]|uniref:Uncharacterized protein n=1 Tax=Paludisphaera mucosa TaxID=3030827 RepID=A0ABT6FHA1_9BACT|nr:hypothetical protein [Paludisphaera mucosa]MDG3006939.1 hypothetical protein [Paludisphaera mucosa]